MFKYRSNGKWYTFDKSLLDPQDTAIFDKMSYPDKLKLITIYTQLKPKENDDVVILKTRKEDSKKDVRRAEYLKKKEKIEEDITKATNETDKNKADAMLAKAQEDLKKLNIEYADVVGITTANEVNVAKANKVVLQDVKQLITQVNDGVNALKSDISEDSFTQLKNTIKQLIDAKTASDTKEIIEQMAATLDELKASDRTQSTKDTADAVKASVEELKNMLEVDPENKTLEDFVNWLGTFTKGDQEQAYILRHSQALALMGEYGITLADTKRVATYPFAMNAIAKAAKTYNEAFVYYKRMANYISYYIALENLAKNQFIAVVDEKEHIRLTGTPKAAVELKYYVSATDKSELDFEPVLNNFIKKFTFNGTPHKEYVYKHRIRDTPNDKASERKDWIFVRSMTYYTDGDAKIDDPDMEKIMNNPRREELNKPGAVETEGKGVLGASWLGIQTKKSAKRDNEVLTNRLLGIIDELKGRVKQNEEDINRLFQKLNEKEVVAVKEDIRPQQVKPNFLTDITKPITLKPTKDDRRLPVIKEPDEVDDLVKALNKRRVDIEYSDDSDDDYVWADGVSLKGGVLAELKKDLEHYGLALNVSKDGKSYYLTVFNRKKVDRSAGGVEEAKMCVDLAKQQGNEMKYTNLKELYEDIY